MLTADIYQPDVWTNFFVLVGTGAVALTGLVFVSMSLNLTAIAGNALHRNRAINTLTGLALVFMRCAFVVMGGQNHVAVGAELLVVTAFSLGVFVRGYVKAIQLSHGLRITRIVGGGSVHLAEMVGATLFLSDHLSGLYIAAIAMVLNTCYMITAAWLLIVGVFDQSADGRKLR